MLLSACTHCDPIKVNDCCTGVSNRFIRTNITSCKIQAPSHPCVQAVIFASEGKEYCCSPRAPWVRAKMIDLKRKGIRARCGRNRDNSGKVKHRSCVSSPCDRHLVPSSPRGEAEVVATAKTPV
uniref:Chemokine interleukin-8-like domain-containing protein n=1 Tax=Anguilla anguilla TaxID=7936 RepID=A0A0E9SQH2_ANGAN